MLSWGSSIITKNLLLVLVLILIPATGRIIQAHGFGPVARTTYWLLEIPVETSRVLFFLLLAGDGKISGGIHALGALLRLPEEDWKIIPNTIINSFKPHSVELIATTTVFIVCILVFNYLIKYGAENPQLLSGLRQVSFLKLMNPQSLTLFFKNLTVIPLTIIFEVWLALRLLDKL